jgi:hypothetical protein
MAQEHELAIRKHVQFEDGGAIAEIFTRGTAPYRKLVTGRQRKPVGRPVMIKAGMRAVEWESIRAEKPMYELCEVATPVHSMFAQPHLLRMKVVGRRKRMDFIPDLQVTVDTGFAVKASSGSFVDAVRNWKPVVGGSVSTMIIEVKDDDDPRNDDPEYQDKLRLAKQVYHAVGWFFITVVRSPDIQDAQTNKIIQRIFLKRKTAISPGDLTAVREAFGAQEILYWDQVVGALGSGPLGRAKAYAMHVRRLISVDVSKPLSPTTRVRRVLDGRPLFEIPGDHPW